MKRGIVAVLVVFGGATAEAKTCREWRTATGMVDYTGGSTQLYANAPVKLEIVDPSGVSKRDGGYLRVTNRSELDIFLSSTAVGLHGQGQDGKSQRSYYVSYMRPPGAMTRFQLSVRYCAKVSP